MPLDIIVDASYFRKLRATAYTFIIDRTDTANLISTLCSSGVSSEQIDNVEAELLGIFSALTELANTYLNVDYINVHCDCEAALDLITGTQITEKHEYNLLKDNVLALLRRNKWLNKITFHHVKGHVNSFDATALQKRNSLVDSLARVTRNKFIQQLTNHLDSGYESNYVSLIPPAKLSGENKLALSYFLDFIISSNLKLRVFIDDDIDLNDSVQELIRNKYTVLNLPYEELVTVTTTQTYADQGKVNRILLRNYLAQSELGNGIDLLENNNVLLATLSSELLHGNHVKAHEYELSTMLVDMSECVKLPPDWTESFVGWAHVLSKSVNCPIFNDPIKAIEFFHNRANIKEHTLQLFTNSQPAFDGVIFNSPFTSNKINKDQVTNITKISPFDAHLKETILQYNDLSQSQLFDKVSLLLDDYNYSKNQPFRDSVARFMMLSTRTVPELYITRLSKHIIKMHVPDIIKVPIKQKIIEGKCVPTKVGIKSITDQPVRITRGK